MLCLGLQNSRGSIAAVGNVLASHRELASQVFREFEV